MCPFFKKKLPHKDVKSPAARHFNSARRWQSPHQAGIKHGLFAYRSQKEGKWQDHPHAAYQWIWRMDHTLPQGSHELHMQRPDWRMMEMHLVTEAMKEIQKMGNIWQICWRASWPSNNTGMNVNLAQASARKTALTCLKGHATFAGPTDAVM